MKNNKNLKKNTTLKSRVAAVGCQTAFSIIFKKGKPYGKTEIKIDYFSSTFPLACDEEDDIQLRAYEFIKLIGIYLNVQGYEVKKNPKSHNNFKYKFTLDIYIFLRCDGPLNQKY